MSFTISTREFKHHLLLKLFGLTVTLSCHFTEQQVMIIQRTICKMLITMTQRLFMTIWSNQTSMNPTNLLELKLRLNIFILERVDYLLVFTRMLGSLVLLMLMRLTINSMVNSNFFLREESKISTLSSMEPLRLEIRLLLTLELFHLLVPIMDKR